MNNHQGDNQYSKGYNTLIEIATFLKANGEN